MKKRFNVAVGLGVASVFVCGALGIMPAAADVKYSESMTMEGAAAGAPAGAPAGHPGAGLGMGSSGTTTYIKEGAERVESVIQAGPMKMDDVRITVCAAKKTYHVDSALKIYSETDLGGAPETHAPSSTAPTHSEPAASPNSGSKATGTLKTNISVKFLGNETVADRKCRHYAVQIEETMQGCAGNGTVTIKEEVWVADYKMPVFNCGDAPYRSMTIPGRHAEGSCGITNEESGDTTEAAEAFRGLIVRMKMTFANPNHQGNNTETTMTRELTSLSEAKLGDELFSIPADYKLVSEQDFQSARSHAMMQAMMSGMGGASSVAAPTQGDDTSKQDNGATNGNQNGDNNGTDDQPKPQPKAPKFKFKLPF